MKACTFSAASCARSASESAESGGDGCVSIRISDCSPGDDTFGAFRSVGADGSTAGACAGTGAGTGAGAGADAS